MTTAKKGRVALILLKAFGVGGLAPADVTKDVLWDARDTNLKDYLVEKADLLVRKDSVGVTDLLPQVLRHLLLACLR